MKRLAPEVFNEDFVDFLQCLAEARVEAMIVGGYAVVLHGYHRITGDLDVWVNPTSENYTKLRRAFSVFGLPTDSISEEAFLSPDDLDVFTFGRPPVAIDIMTHVKGVSFAEAYAQAEEILIGEVPARLIHLNHLKQAKKSAGRHKDLDDLEHL